MAPKSFKEFLDEIRAAHDHEYDSDGVRIEIRTSEGVQYLRANEHVNRIRE